jgi:hypothetical protein
MIQHENGRPIMAFVTITGEFEGHIWDSGIIEANLEWALGITGYNRKKATMAGLEQLYRAFLASHKKSQLAQQAWHEAEEQYNRAWKERRAAEDAYVAARLAASDEAVEAFDLLHGGSSERV